MYNLLIVDDETALVNSLYEYINRNFSAEYECLKAYSSRQALEIAEHIRVDIAVLDIEMPGMNGLELRERIKQAYPYCHIIFLTAYDRFDYAYAAAQQHQTRFLLKTEGYVSVLQMIQEERDALDQELIHGFLPPGQKPDLFPDYGKNDFLRLIMNSNIDAASIQKEASQFPIALDVDRPVMPVLLRLPNTEMSYSEEKEELVRLVSFFKTWFADRYRQICMQMNRRSLLFLMQPLDENQIQIDLKQELELFLGKAVQASGSQISLALADTWTQWEYLGSTVKLLSIRLENAPEDGKDYVCQLDAQTLARAQLMQIGDDLIQLIKKCRKEKLRKKIQEGLALSEMLNVSFSEFLFRQFEKIHLQATLNKWEYGFKQMAQFAYQLEKAQTEEDLEAITIEFAQGIFRERNPQTSEELKYALRKANEFIEEHYSEDISLTDIARYVCLSSSYLSRIYKKETGINIVEKIKEVRISAATRLLKTTNLKIQDIASATGFHSSRYFLSVFRSVTGISPAEYREGT